jgi:hypothetical protein
MKMIIIGWIITFMILLKETFFPSEVSFQSDLIALTVIQILLFILWILVCRRMIEDEFMGEFIV